MRTRIFSFSNDLLKIHHTRDDLPDPAGFVLHAHRGYELYYFLSGVGHYTVEGTEYPLSPGCLLVMRDGEAHTPHLFGKEPYERISVNFSAELLPQLSAEIRAVYCDRPLGKNNFYQPVDESAAYIAACMKRMCRDGDSPDYPERASVLLMSVLLELSALRREEKASGSAVAPIARGGSAETVSRIIAYINENLTTIENLDVLEQEFFFSKAYINRMFKQSTGSSVWDYIVLKRLLLSRSLLRAGKQASIVASECGFSDYSSFFRQFKQRFGISPLAARKMKN